ncbi:MAG: hypothetical protein A3E07_03685 [Candidatus Wildermuthbacteria bacterium RIFCSPHIGHO2_12_FULL_45_9]|uniref:NADH:ubiquinone oxidoreductase-like 20kDa subunit domain-containing protein n=1 Tax=Candidatus Wildermuthbacteria bacterium RIFCSPHIGHO2_02_FULL_45_25 TaxID=1802450 RepID=A0A1G2R2P5_9BACT|nr:MAG: hypothetical protein A3C04_03470 [Candidatus Wildermuthbacteria bacterium RIFCSPHIGHO2_02_FULL_45_25]OHA72423.1 MAG: hypothetical protein A3E07_03685 [Candidatus Wildermuthbacteria bacterium RIFCSPHIGHO2_12_FULL_45_9]
MFGLFFKVFSTPDYVVSVADIKSEEAEVFEVGQKLEKYIKKLFKGSLAIREVDAGSDNSVEQELVALSNPFYDVERFGVRFVASPRHADMLMVTGPVTRNMKEALKRAYHATPNPKIVVAVGDDAINGGIYKHSYAVEDGAESTVPVDYHIPGDPPSPMTILRHLLLILEVIDEKKT